MSILNVDGSAVLEKLVAPRLPQPVSVLVLGDNQPILGSVTAVLEEHRYEVCACPRPASLGSLLLERTPEAVVVDLDDISGLGSDFQSWSLSRNLGGQSMTFSAGVAGVDQDDARDLSVLERPEQLIAVARRAVNAARASGTAQVAVAWRRIC